MLYELANDDGYIGFRWAAEDRDEWKKTCSSAEFY